MGVSEKVIQERTGHKSLEALRTYNERMKSRQHETMSHLLSNPIGRETTMNNIRVASQTSQSLNPSNCNISFGNLQSCTINISTAPAPPNNSYHLTDKEFEDVTSCS